MSKSLPRSDGLIQMEEQAAAFTNESQPTTERGKHNEKFAAQPDNLAVDRAATLLRTAANVLQSQAEALQGKPTRRAREEFRRILAGVVAKVETVRYALKD